MDGVLQISFCTNGNKFQQGSLEDCLFVSGRPWCQKSVNDVLIGAPSIQALLEHKRIVLRRCCEKGIVMSQLIFAGFRVGGGGVKPDPAKVPALSDFKAPKSDPIRTQQHLYDPCFRRKTLT
eukprot:TCALIF_08237-PA protein Name:"Protein of unknown function" AED:0.22 eAED:0.41 QI:0/0/0/1/0/0/2/0/121